MRVFAKVLLGALWALGAGLPGAVALAEAPVPEKRFVLTRDVDFYGQDLQALFDSSLEACEAVCRNDPACQAFTYNRRSDSCFPKTGVSRRDHFEGAVSGEAVATPPEVVARARLRAEDLGFLESWDLTEARDEAHALGRRYSAGQWSVAALRSAAEAAEQRGDLRDAVSYTGAALAQTDAAEDWLAYGLRAEAYMPAVTGGDFRRQRDRAFAAAINAYLRAPEAATRRDALLLLARLLEEKGRGREMIPALRLAQDLAPDMAVTTALDSAVARYGFRIVDHQVEADSALPRLCAEFNEPLVAGGQDYAPYVALPDARLAVSASDTRLCVSGLTHGARYTLRLRAGLPAASGEVLQDDVEITAYVRDRAPVVRFPGRAYVLPRAADAGLPVETVNLDRLSVVLRRVSDRNLIRAIQDDYFARPLAYYAETHFAETLAEEVWRGEAEVEMRLNQSVRTRLPVGPLVAGAPAGIYTLTAAAPDSETGDAGRATQWFMLSDIGLTTLAGSDGLTVVARGLSDAGALPGLEVSLVSRANRVLATARTDDTGVARFDTGLMRGTGGAAPALIMAARGDEDLAVLSLIDPAFDLSDRGVAGRAPSGPLDAFLATDRGAYRAGEVIHATALLRDAQARAVAGVPLTAVLRRPDGVEHARQTEMPAQAGGQVFDFALAPGVARGAWTLDILADPEAPPLASQRLLVEDFVPERIDFDLGLPDGALDPRALPALQVEARYLFGAPGSDLAIEGSLALGATRSLPGYDGYRFGRHDAGVVTRRAPLGAGQRTDATGHADLALRLPEIATEGRATELEAVLRLSEVSGRPVERRITRPVAPQQPLIGLRPAFDGTLPEGGQARFDVVAVGPALDRVALPVRWQINRVTTRYQWYETYGTWQWEPMTTRETIAQGEATLGEAPLRLEADVDWGDYELVVESTQGAYAVASEGFSAGWYAPADAADSPDMLELSLDRPAYRAGDVAQLRVVPRAAGQLLVSVLADRVISMQVVEVAEGASTLALPVTEEWGAGVYVTAQLLRPADVAQGVGPARALGLAHAAVDPGAGALDVQIDAPFSADPRGALEVGVQVAGLAPGAQAYVTLAAVDLGILNLTAFETPDPQAHYFGQRRLGVEIRDLYGRLIDGRSGPMGALRSGGDAAAALRMQSPPPTEALLALFQGPVVLDAEGRARVTLDLPDFNGTVRLMALGWSDRGVGSAEADVLVRDPVVIATAMPRFLAPGDAAQLTLEMTHATGPAGEMALAVTAPGLDLGAVPERITLAEGGSTRVSVPITARTAGVVPITVTLTPPGGPALTRSLTLGVRVGDPQVAQTRRLSLAPGQSVTLDQALFAGMHPEGATLMVSGGALARFDVPGLLAALTRYPYGCTEQVVSQAVPLLSYGALAGPLGLSADPSAQIAAAIDQLQSRQAPNGAFGLWQADSGDTWLTAYVTDFLLRARDRGHEVPQRVLTSALDVLAARVAYAGDFDDGGEGLAYALYVLAREGRAAMGDLRYFADAKAEDFGSALAQAQIGAALAGYGDQPRADAMFRAASARLGAYDDRRWRADYGSTLRDAAGVLMLASEAGSEAVDRPALLQRLAGAGSDLSPQEQAWSLRAVSSAVTGSGAEGLRLAGAPLQGPFAQRFAAESLTPVVVENTGDRAQPLTLTTLGRMQGQTQASGYGYALDRAYYTLEGRPVTQIQQGDRMVVVLTVRPATSTRARLMVDDALPAGFEIDTPSLLRSGSVAGLSWLTTTEPAMAEFRTDRFLAALDQEGADPMRLAYVVRAVSPGAFHQPAALVSDMYRPEFRATTASGRVTIAP